MSSKPKPSNAPTYCAMYPALAELVREHGYALCPHGSLQRDFDLVCIPWTDEVSTSRVVVDDILESFAFEEVGTSEVRVHGREIYTLTIGFGECFLDLSFMPADNYR